MKKYFFLAFIALFAVILAPTAKVTAEPINLNALLGNQEEVLPVDEAFKLTAEILDNTVIVKFEIENGYYMYRERFGFSAENATIGEPMMADGVEKDDPYFGLTEVYKVFYEASVPFTSNAQTLVFTVDFQGCATDRLCYPPTSRTVELELGGSAEQFVSEQKQLEKQLEEDGYWLNFFKFMLLGIGLAFTPCVFPMIPIISGIIAGQGKDISNKKAFGLAITYTQAVAIVYTILGIAVALAGQSLSGYLQQPAFVISAAVVFIILSLSMFGFYELQMPAGLQAKLAQKSNNQQAGSYIGSAIMGAISALIVSPCVTAPLIAILIFISKSQDVLLGATALYGLGVGMGIPLIIIAVTGGKFLPKAGAWMDGIKAAFGVVMLGVAIYLVKHLLSDAVYMYAWASLALVPGFYLFSNQLPSKGFSTLFKALGLASMIYGALLIIGGASGNRNLLEPLKATNHAVTSKTEAPSIDKTKSISEHSQQNPAVTFKPTGHNASILVFTRIKTLADLKEKVTEANLNGQTVMLDFFAEWCAACYEFEELVFTDSQVQAALSNTLLLQADVTDNDAQDVELMQAFDVLGLPSIMFFDGKGNELSDYRATGFEEADVFARRIKAAFR